MRFEIYDPLVPAALLLAADRQPEDTPMEKDLRTFIGSTVLHSVGPSGPELVVLELSNGQAQALIRMVRFRVDTLSAKGRSKRAETEVALTLLQDLYRQWFDQTTEEMRVSGGADTSA